MNRFTLRKFLSISVEQLAKEMKEENQKLEKHLGMIEQTYFIACSAMLEEVVEDFKKKRAKIWKLAW